MKRHILPLVLWLVGLATGLATIVQGITGWSGGNGWDIAMGAGFVLIYGRWFVRELRDARAAGEPRPIVLDRPEEVGLQYDDGGDLLVMAAGGVLFVARGCDQYWMDANEARDWAAQLAAMADALDAAEKGGRS
ncbi:hypothetical protein AB0I81_22460 [Nonomuraea sp. NPDC050404]|uniref:hypothetical protein n=1 Tax=Nonomuraea sp. NPDC050404 TaxID=3155783 RepID=UPI0033D91EC5